MKNLIALVLMVLVLVPGLAVAKDDQPVSFSTTLAQFISYSDDVTALTAWYETLSSTEQAAYTEQFNTAHAKLAAQEEGLVAAVTAQLDCGCMDSNLYLTFDTIKGMDPIKARKIFASSVDKISARLNMDYLQSPSNPDLARRARDMQAVRAYIGHNN